MSARWILPTLVVGALAVVLVAGQRRRTPTTPELERPSTDDTSEFVFAHEVIGEDNPHLPIVIGFHGLGSNANEPRRWFEDFDRPVRLIYLDGVEPYPGSTMGRRWWALRSKTEDQAELARQMHATADVVANFLASVERAYPEAPIYVVGHSQGGMMALALGALYPEYLHGVVASAAWLPQEIRERVGSGFAVPTHIVHGTNDKTVSFARTDEWLSSVSDDPNLRYQPIAGAGHGLKGVLRDAFLAAVEDAI